MTQFATFVTLLVLRGYKWAISPMIPPACRYVPSCSEYAMEAVERYGIVRGGLMALWRLQRCHPFARGGYDPVVKSGDNSTLPQGLKPSSFFDFIGTAGSRALPKTAGAGNGGLPEKVTDGNDASLVLPKTIAGSGVVDMSRCNHAKASRIAHHVI